MPQHLLNVTRALLFLANIPKSFWSHAVAQVAFLINRIPPKTLNNSSSFELLHNHPVDFFMLEVFGYLSFASIFYHFQTKLDPCVQKCIYLSHSHGTKGYVLFDLKYTKAFISKHIVLYENILPFHSITHNLDLPLSPNTSLPFPACTNDPSIDYTPPSAPNTT